jgi:hypothetical protein
MLLTLISNIYLPKTSNDLRIISGLDYCCLTPGDAFIGLTRLLARRMAFPSPCYSASDCISFHKCHCAVIFFSELRRENCFPNIMDI